MVGRVVAGLDCETKLGVVVVPEAGAPVVLGPEPDVACLLYTSDAADES